jgi:hypothetical protein
MLEQRQKVKGVVALRMIAVMILISGIVTGPLLGQEETRAWGQFFGGFGAITGDGSSQGVVHVGGGGEALLAGGGGITGEIGYLSNYRDFSGGIGVFSVGGIYAFSRDRKTVPFVSGGYTLFFRSGTENGFFFGGGFNRWIGEGWGIRIEGRDQVFASDTGIHVLEARFAIILK